MAYTNRELLARLIRCEAEGEGDNGMRAVATVVMNRVNVSEGEYLRTGQGNLRRVIDQPYQFTCVMGQVAGQPNPQTIWSSPPEPIHYEIADWAIGGGLYWGVGNSLWYMNPYGNCPQIFPRNGSGKLHTPLNQHCYYRPTPQYANT